MENRINIAELLKGCPTGMELDSTMFEKVTFVGVQMDRQFPIEIAINGIRSKYLTKEGCFHDITLLPEAKCVIFPKGKNTWEGFHRPFKDGDILINDRGSIFIYKGPMYYNKNLADFYCGCRSTDRAFILKQFKDKHFGDINECRFATEDEKLEFFQTIKDNGYKWNSEIKTLEKLIKPKFKNGDVLYIQTAVPWICIYKEGGEKENVYHRYVALTSSIFVHDDSALCHRHVVKEIRHATEEEKVMLFQAIKDHGYHWNFQAKRLEELITPKFKRGDKVRVKNGVSEPRIIDDVCDTFYSLVPIGKIDFTDQDNWELVPDKLIEPKFKVGDKIKYKGTNEIFIITYKNDLSYYVNNTRFAIWIKDQDNYELVPNKFDITTLKPFESRVLIRDNKEAKWRPAVWGYYDNEKHIPYPYVVVGGLAFACCIPYEGNEHLRGTTDDCEDFYKTW